jgi:hypothetical protein
MKKILLTLLASVCLTAGAQSSLMNYDWSTTQYVGGIRIIGDTPLLAFQKTSNNVAYLQGEISNLSTNAITGLSLTATNLTPGSSATVTNTGVYGGIAYFTIGIPAGSNGVAGASGTNAYYYTNTIAYYSLSNAMVSSATFTLLNTNFNFAASNYLGKFTNIQAVATTAPIVGGGGLTPGSLAPTANFYSTTGTNGWTTVLPSAPNVLYLAVTSSATGAGTVKITGITNPNAQRNTNDFTSQTVYVPTATDTRSPVPLSQLNLALAQITTFQSSGTNYYVTGNGQRMLELNAPQSIFSTNISFVIDGTGTNWALSVATTNRVAGAGLVMSTNLVLPFLPFTGTYTLATNSGIATYSIPISAVPASQAFFQVAAPIGGSVQVDYPLAVNVTTNQIIWGATNTAPANTSTPVAWVSVQVNGRTNAYRVPLYQ